MQVTLRLELKYKCDRVVSRNHHFLYIVVTYAENYADEEIIGGFGYCLLLVEFCRSAGS